MKGCGDLIVEGVGQDQLIAESVHDLRDYESLLPDVRKSRRRL
jgi:hypothetical protein